MEERGGAIWPARSGRLAYTVALHYGRHPRQLFETHDRKPHRVGRLAPGLGHDLAGFGVRVYPNGRKQRFVTLGRYGEMTVHEARTEAMAVLLSVRRGEDPSGDRIAYRNSPTMEDLAERHMSEHVRPRKKPIGIENDAGIWRRRRATR